jgi:hypothetical protein
MLHGRCSCGAVSFAIDSLPRDVYYCHCSMCRRATGSAFAVLAVCDSPQVSWFGTPASEFRSSNKAVRGFCGTCGSPLFMKYNDRNDIALYVGAFDDPQAFVPTHHCGVEGRLVWVDIAASLPCEPGERTTLVQALADLPASIQRNLPRSRISE